MATFEIYNPDGTLQIDLGSKLTKVIGVIDTVYGATGSIYEPKIMDGVPWWVESSNFTPGIRSGSTLQPKVTMNRSTGIIAWSNRGAASNQTPIQITYGIYSNG